MSADYGLTPQPNTSDPDPLAKSQQSLAYSQAGVDTGELIIRGGTHYEFSFIPNAAFGGNAARRRRGRLVHDRLVRQVREGRRERRQAAADEPLAVTTRSRPRSTRTTTATCSPSTTRRGSTSGSRGGGRFTCEDLRTGCAGMVSSDGWSGGYSYLEVATSPDG